MERELKENEKVYYVMGQAMTEEQYRTMIKSIKGLDYKSQLEAINKFRSGG